MQKAVCPICGGKKISDLRDIPTYHFCHLCHTAWLKKFPQASYGRSYFTGKSSLASKLFGPIASLLLEIRKSYTGTAKKNLWIDVGAGGGEFLARVRAKKKLGVEISVAARKSMARFGVEVLTPNQFLKKRKLAADVISFWQVLEHLENPWDYLAAAKKNLAQNGKIVIGIPNIDSFDFQFFGRHWFHLAPQYHLWHFSPKSLRLLLKRTGFKIEKIDYWSIEHHLPGILQSFINKTSGSYNALHGLVKRGEGTSFATNDAFWSIFWLTLGLPLVLTFWLVNSLAGRSGTIVVVARLSKTLQSAL